MMNINNNWYVINKITNVDKKNHERSVKKNKKC